MVTLSPKPIDLRSDTVTQPTPAMRQAIASAEVGDDVYGEDPSVRRLEERAAELTDKEAALFVPSGTMANQIALGVLSRPGDEVIIGAGSHCYLFECGAGAALNGLQFQIVGSKGRFTAEDIRAAYKSDRHYQSPTTVVAFENTHNRGGGWVWNLQELQEAAEIARDRKMHLHLDGARIFNAQVASKIPVKTWAQPFDTIAFCLSKGLGAPAGSLLCGSGAHIDRARRLRKRFGGAMRQAGILASAGLYALEHHVERLADDHANAKLLARLLAEIPGVVLEPASVETSIIRFDLVRDALDAETAILLARDRGVLLSYSGGRSLRAVTHLNVSSDDCAIAAEIITEILAK
jgi:threonine aldolase